MIKGREGSGLFLKRALKEKCWMNQTNNQGGLKLTSCLLWGQFDEFLSLFSVCVCVMILCMSVLCVYFSGKPRAKKKQMESTEVFHLHYSSFFLQHWRHFLSFSVSLPLHATVTQIIFLLFRKHAHWSIYNIGLVYQLFRTVTSHLHAGDASMKYLWALLNSVPMHPPWSCFSEDESSGCLLASFSLP